MLRLCFTPSSLAGNGTDGFFLKGGDEETVFGVGNSDRRGAAARKQAAAATGVAEADIELVSVAAQERGKLPRT